MSNHHFDWAGKWAIYSPKKIALYDVDEEHSISYEAIDQKAQAIAACLKDGYSIKKGDRVAVLSTFSIPYFALFFAAQKLGFILVPLNYRLSVREIDFLLNDSGASVLFYETGFEHLIPEKYRSSKPCRFLNELLNLDEKAFENVDITEKDPVFLLYTSGTTGFPKGAIYTHGMMLWNGLNTALRLKVNSDDSTLMVMPPFHTGGWNVLSTPLLHFGATVYFMRKFDAEQVLKSMQNFDIKLFMAVPTMVKMLTEIPTFAKASFPALRYFIVGGEALPITLIETWAQKGVPIRQGYGLTEAGPNITSLPEEDAIRKRGSVGFMNFYVEYQIVDEEGKVQPRGKQGELWLKGSMLTPGYWRNEEANKNSFVEGWFKTGDVFIEDEEGYLYVVDRIKNMYISGGENVYPAEVEKYLRTHPEVLDVAVVGVPDEKWGESGKAFVVKASDNSLNENDLLEYCRMGLAKFKIPKQFVFVNELPKTDTGKIDKKKLR